METLTGLEFTMAHGEKISFTSEQCIKSNLNLDVLATTIRHRELFSIKTDEGYHVINGAQVVEYKILIKFTSDKVPDVPVKEDSPATQG